MPYTRLNNTIIYSYMISYWKMEVIMPVWQMLKFQYNVLHSTAQISIWALHVFQI